MNALLALGFRPFYLLAASFAALGVLLWAARWSGALGPVAGVDLDWHAHEMLFGYALGVIAGFLLTAVRNWTDRPTPTGAWLAALAGLWLAARILMLTPCRTAAALVSAAFPLALALALGIPLVRSGNRRNYFFLALLAALALAAASHHGARLGWVGWSASLGLRVALDVVLFIMAVMGGRVIPTFSNNGIPGLRARRQPLVEAVALGSVLVLLAADALQRPVTVTLPLLVVAALAHAVRFALWQPWRTLRVPLVWVLHAGYVWIPLHLALRAAAEIGRVPAPLATHALTVGAIGTLTLGMMTRTARGHTGRPLRADGYETTAYLLVASAASVRVFGGLVLPALYRESVSVAAALWSAAFALYAIRYWPVLTRPRIDGRPG